MQEAQLLADDLHLHILMHPAYGKGFMKKCNLSPDAYIQMALQLAYYRLISMRANHEFVIYSKLMHDIVCPYLCFMRAADLKLFSLTIQVLRHQRGG